MTNLQPTHTSKKGFFSYFREALNSEHQDFTQGSIRKAVFMLAIPMILEMCMESVFAVVDIFFVSKLGAGAAATVGLTESFLTLIYSVAIGLSMAATAMVARRVGEKIQTVPHMLARRLYCWPLVFLYSSASLVFSLPPIYWHSWVPMKKWLLWVPTILALC